MKKDKSLKAIIGLGNPGRRYNKTRHNIGFKILDALVQQYNTSWKPYKNMELASLIINDDELLLVKPQTTMNNSGAVMPWLQKKGITADSLLVVHDELELPFGVIKLKEGGSARGHNGIRSLIDAVGPDFLRLRFGIGRPENREQVADYVLRNFTESDETMESTIEHAVKVINELL